MASPKVLFAARLMPPLGGGIERLSADVLEALKRSFQVEDFSNRGSRRTQLMYLSTVGLRLRLRAHRLRGVVVDGGDATSSPALAFAKRPSVIRVHGLDLLYPNPSYQFIIRRYLPRVSTIVANSEPTRELLKKFGIPRERTRVVNPAADPPSKWTYSPVRGKILFIGRMVRRKGLAEFLKNVWPLIVQEIPAASVEIVGEGPERTRIEDAIAQAPARNQIQLHGSLSRTNLERKYAKADVLIMMNRSLRHDFEGFGIVAIEAAVRGVPVVARTVDGIADAVLHEKTGLHVFTDDSSEAAEAVISVIERRVLSNREALQQTARLRYGKDRLARQYAEVIRETWEVHGRGKE